MNRHEFELMFSQGKEKNLDWFHKVGMFARPCDCGRTYCEDWVMDSILNMDAEQIDQIPLEDLAGWISFSLDRIRKVKNEAVSTSGDTNPQESCHTRQISHSPLP